MQDVRKMASIVSRKKLIVDRGRFASFSNKWLVTLKNIGKCVSIKLDILRRRQKSRAPKVRNNNGIISETRLENVSFRFECEKFFGKVRKSESPDGLYPRIASLYNLSCSIYCIVKLQDIDAISE